jgi:hypothetical protein
MVLLLRYSRLRMQDAACLARPERLVADIESQGRGRQSQWRERWAPTQTVDRLSQRERSRAGETRA